MGSWTDASGQKHHDMGTCHCGELHAAEHVLRRENERLRAVLSRYEEAREALEPVGRFDGPKLRHWLGSQDVLHVDATTAQVVTIVHGAIRARAALEAPDER